MWNAHLDLPARPYPHNISDIHNRGVSMSCWDGHAKWMSGQSVPSGRHGNGIKFVAEDPFTP